MKYLKQYKLYESSKISNKILNDKLIKHSQYPVTATVKKLIASGANINYQNSLQQTALMMSTTNENPNIGLYLIESGADLNLQDYNGLTALMYACINCHQLIIESIIKKGADLSIQDNKGKTFVDYLAFWIKSEWAIKYETQKLIFEKEPSLISEFKKNNIKIHYKIKGEYPHLFRGIDLNLL
jgi:hypothetical protein